jgi:thioredoxin 1
MNPELFDPIQTRLLWSLGIIVAGVGLYWLINRLILARAKRNAAGVNLTRLGSPVLLYFTTPTCAPCKTVQRPAIKKVKDRLGKDLRVIEIDASAQPEVANLWGVMSVPTTFIIDDRGQPRHVNHGITTADKLLKQVYNLR